MKFVTETIELPSRRSPDKPARVTVVIPAFNAADTLELAVRSALSQTIEDVEIHIVDDGSTDTTWELITALQNQNAAIHATRLVTNRGRPFAGNYAFERASSKWVAILDADDWYEPDRLAQVIAAAEAANVEMGTDNQSLIDPGTRTVVGTGFPPSDRIRKLDLDAFQANSDATLSFDVGMLKPVFLRDFIMRHQIEYYDPARRGQDYYILLSFFAAGGRAAVVEKPLYNYVQPFGRVSRQWSSTSRKRYPFEAMKQVNSHFVEKFHDAFTPRQRHLLIWRGSQFDGLAAIHQIREAIAEKRYLLAASRVLTGSPAFWWTVGALIKRKGKDKLTRPTAGLKPAMPRLHSTGVGDKRD